MGTLEANRYLYLTTPLGDDALLLRSFRGTEGLSELFRFELELLAENETSVDFDKLIAQKVSFGVQGNDPKLPARDLHGIVTEFSQGKRDFNFTAYKMTVVPEVWKLTRRFRSRIFQHVTVPNLLKTLFLGFDVSFEIIDEYEPREYITQYQESDFAFASRLMEEEGIHYFFRFTRGAHKFVVGDTPQSHGVVYPDVTFEDAAGHFIEEERITEWNKVQVWDSGKHTVWDHHFELPHKHLQATEIVKEKVKVGSVTHTLKIMQNETLEVLEHPGRYALRYDGIDQSGGKQTEDLQNIFIDNKVTAEDRMEAAEGAMLRIEGASNCRQLTAGHQFTLWRHFNGDGQYLLTSVVHDGQEGSFRADGGAGDKAKGHYSNTFLAQPFELPYRPPRRTPRPSIAGTTTAVVVGPAGEEIHTDEYGRVKVKFMWDPAEDSTDNSCWTRVATSWAGAMWGSISIPRIGHEVVVAFENGDPDAPMIVGSVYNADQMPPYILPDFKTVSTIKSHSSKGGSRFDNYNELRFEDRLGSEQVFFQAERDKDERVKAESREYVGGNRHLIVKKNQLESVAGSKHSTVGGDAVTHIVGERHSTVDSNAMEFVGGNVSQMIGGARKSMVLAGQHELIVGPVTQEIQKGDHTIYVADGDTLQMNSGGNWRLEVNKDITVNGRAVTITADDNSMIRFVVGQSQICIMAQGIMIESPLVQINCGFENDTPVPGVQIVPPLLPDLAKDAAAPDVADSGLMFGKDDLSDKM